MSLTSKELMAALLAEYGSLDSAMFYSDTDGICRSCGNIQSGVEPDAENYRCEDCGEDEVFGIEHVILTSL